MTRAVRLAAAGVGFTYWRGGRPILRDVTLALEPGQVTAILGPNGAGKSTLLRLLAGLLRADAGEVTLDGRALARWRPRALATQIAVVFDPPEMPFSWTSFELVLMGRAPHLASGRFESDEDRRRASEALAQVAASELADRPYQALSAGERQRVLMARAICQDTAVLLLDEPTSHLDPAHALGVAGLLRELARDGRAVGVVLHDLNLAARAADRLAVLAGGRLRALGPPGEVLTPGLLAEVYGVGARRVDGPEGVSVLVGPLPEAARAAVPRRERGLRSGR